MWGDAHSACNDLCGAKRALPSAVMRMLLIRCCFALPSWPLQGALGSPGQGSCRAACCCSKAHNIPARRCGSSIKWCSGWASCWRKQRQGQAGCQDNGSSWGGRCSSDWPGRGRRCIRHSCSHSRASVSKEESKVQGGRQGAIKASRSWHFPSGCSVCERKRWAAQGSGRTADEQTAAGRGLCTFPQLHRRGRGGGGSLWWEVPCRRQGQPAGAWGWLCRE